MFLLVGKLFGGPEGVARLDGYEVPFIIDTNSLRYRGVFRTVGLTMTGRQVEGGCPDDCYIRFRVFDPGVASQKVFDSLGAFLDSSYGRVYELKQVMPLEHFDELFPKHFGPDAPHVHPEVPTRIYGEPTKIAPDVNDIVDEVDELVAAVNAGLATSNAIMGGVRALLQRCCLWRAGGRAHARPARP